MPSYGGPPTPYDPPPSFSPGPPRVGEPDPELWAQRRANLDAGARPRLSSGQRAWIIVGLIFVFILGCGALASVGFRQDTGLSEEIESASAGRVQFVQTFGLGGVASVSVHLAPGVSEAEGRVLLCDVVMPRLLDHGIAPFQVSLFTSDTQVGVVTLDELGSCAGSEGGG